MSLNWFNTTTEGGVQSTSYTGNFKVVGDIEVTGLVRRNGEVFESITPQWSNTNTPGKIYYNLDDTTILVGIGTSDPQTPAGALLKNTLSVAGNISYTGDIYRNGARLDFGFGAWTGDKSGTVFYGGGDNNRIGVGEGFVKSEDTSAPSIPAKATIHAWSLSTYNSVNAESWNQNMGIRVGPHKVNSPFLQAGVMEDTTESISSINRNWSWIQSAKYTSNTIDANISRLMINPRGGNVGFGVRNISNVDAAISISSFDQFASSNGFRRAISLAPETHESVDSSINYNSLIYSKSFGLGFRDEDADGGLYIMTNSVNESFRRSDWERSVQFCVRNDGNVGIGTVNPRLKLTVSSSSSNGILISNPNITQTGVGNIPISGFGLQLRTDNSIGFSNPATGLGIGYLRITDTGITNNLIVTDSGIRVIPRVEATEYYIGDNVALISNTLGSSIVNSSLTSVGNLSSLTVSGPTTINNNLNVSGTTTASSFNIGGNTVLSPGQLGPSITSSSLTSFGTLLGLSVNGSTSLNGGVIVGGGLTVGGDMSVGGIIRSSENTVEIGSEAGPNFALRNTFKTVNTATRTWRIWNMTGKYENSLQFWRYTGLNETPSGATLILMDNGDTRIAGRLRIGLFYIEVNQSEFFIKHDHFPNRYSMRFVDNGASTFQWGAGDGRPHYYGATSDIRLKDNIKNISSANMLESVLKLKPIEFEYTDKKYGDKKLGFSAQDVNEIIPRAVTKNEGSLFTIDCMADVLNDRTMLYMRSKPKTSVICGQCISILVGDVNPYEMKVDVIDINDDIIKISQAISSDFTEVHIYGHVQNDIHVLDFTVITAANTSAIQELSNKLSKANIEIEYLKSELINLKSLITRMS